MQTESLQTPTHSGLLLRRLEPLRLGSLEAVRALPVMVQQYVPILAQKRLLAMQVGDARWANVWLPLGPLSREQGLKLAEQQCTEIGLKTARAHAET
ncbi:MAG: hypothetical protein QNJ35_05300 [Paracoccaceae bacterium]|nr:hypothetical protein [Paracoccaceae bacterium]